jgi:rod shape determining protein RodA
MDKRDSAYRNSSLFYKIDWVVFSIYLILIVIGIATIYSTAYSSENPSLFSFSAKYGKQIAWVGVSFFLGFLIFLIDASIYQKFAYFIYGFCLILLVIVLFMPPVNGARAWLGIGTLGIQPAEFAKIGTALALAKMIPTLNLRIQNISSVIKVNALIIIPMILIILQPDAGSVVVFTAFLFVLYREGISYDPIILKVMNFVGIRHFKSTWIGNHFIPLLFFIVVTSMLTLLKSSETITFDNFPGIELPGVYGILFFFLGLLVLMLLFTFTLLNKKDRGRFTLIFIVNFIVVTTIVISVDSMFQTVKPHQKERIELFLGLREDPNGDDYNRNRAMAAVGSGGLYGKGYKQASLSSTEANHVPESETDFIFCPLSEEWGFVGSGLVVILYSILFVRIIFIAERQRSAFTRIYAYAVATILFYHFAINIGMDIGFAPVIGIPLPFVSYGGSSMMSFSVMLFVLLKLDSQRLDFF